VSVLASVRVAVRALGGNPLRSVLTTLGVIIGVAAVVTTVSIGAGARRSVEEQLTALGTNLLTVLPGRAEGPGRVGQGLGSVQTLTWEDALAIQRSVPEVEAVAAEFNRTAQVVAGGYNDTTTVSGVTPSFPHVRNWQPVEGAFFTEEDMRRRARVAVLGQTVRETLFPGQDPVGQTIRIQRAQFTVIGVMDRKGSTGFGDRDDVVFVPLSTAQKRLFGVDHVRAVYVKVRDAASMQAVASRIEGLLRERHRIPEDGEPDFVVRNQADLIQAFTGVTQTITLLLGAIAAVSLVVGGIGIMNIMLVSVTERTREIGIRKAVGATHRDILVQFLVEAVLLSVGGGVLGVLVALGAARTVAALAGWATVVTPQAVPGKGLQGSEGERPRGLKQGRRHGGACQQGAPRETAGGQQPVREGEGGEGQDRGPETSQGVQTWQQPDDLRREARGKPGQDSPGRGQGQGCAEQASEQQRGGHVQEPAPPEGECPRHPQDAVQRMPHRPRGRAPPPQEQREGNEACGCARPDRLGHRPLHGLDGVRGEVGAQGAGQGPLCLSRVQQVSRQGAGEQDQGEHRKQRVVRDGRRQGGAVVPQELPDQSSAEGPGRPPGTD
jgi:putative ABC transport system permease protein